MEASQLIIYLAGQISNCYSFIHADVTNSSDLSFHLGAIGGKNEGIIQNCYSDATLASIQNADRNNIISGIVLTMEEPFNLVTIMVKFMVQPQNQQYLLY